MLYLSIASPHCLRYSCPWLEDPGPRLVACLIVLANYIRNTFHAHKPQTAGQGLNFEKHLQEKYIVGNISSYLSW